MASTTDITIKHNGDHVYHLENIGNADQHRDIEVYLDGMFIHSFTNLLSAIGHCLEVRTQQTDIGYVLRNRT